MILHTNQVGVNVEPTDLNVEFRFGALRIAITAYTACWATVFTLGLRSAVNHHHTHAQGASQETYRSRPANPTHIPVSPTKTMQLDPIKRSTSPWGASFLTTTDRPRHRTPMRCSIGGGSNSDRSARETGS